MLQKEQFLETLMTHATEHHLNLQDCRYNPPIKLPATV
jgi:hypothetical protein